MKRLIPLALAFLMLPSARAADWQPLSPPSPSGAGSYVDLDGIAPSGVRVLTNHRRPVMGAWSVIDVYRADCGRRTLRLLSSSGFSGQDGQGDPVFGEVPISDKSSSPVAGTLGDRVLDEVCGKRRGGDQSGSSATVPE